MSLPRKIQARDACFLIFLACSLLLFWAPLHTLLRFALKYEYEHYSHILLIPVVSVVLIYLERNRIFAKPQWSYAWGASLLLVGIGLFSLSSRFAGAWTENDFLSLRVLGIVTTWLGGFTLCYGVPALRTGMFPLLFLLLMVPIPDLVLQNTISWLVRGSAEVTDVLFRLAGVPVYRNDAVFVLPGFTIEVAKECSGIRSSLALFITALLAGHFFLRSNWRRALLIGAALPILIVKNGARIVTLTLLAVYVDPAYLAGNLHRRGGVVFFALGLVILWPILRLLEKTEKKAENGNSKNLAEVRNLPAGG